MSALSDRVLRELHGEAPLYFIVDGARHDRLRRWVQNSGAAAWCLYAGKLPPELEDAAPWLVRMLRGHSYTDRLLELGWDDNWGIALASEAPSKLLRRHLRRFLLARAEDGRKLVFRFYDPRVLRAYLPSCTPAELSQFFGPVSAFASSDRQRGVINVFRLRREPEGLEHRRVAVS